MIKGGMIMSQFAGDDTISICDAVSDGKYFVPSDATYKPTSKRRKVIWITVGVLVALFMIVTGIQVLLSLFS